MYSKDQLVAEARLALSIYNELYINHSPIEVLDNWSVDGGLCHFSSIMRYWALHTYLFYNLPNGYIYMKPMNAGKEGNINDPDESPSAYNNPLNYTEPWQALLPRIELLEKIIKKNE